MKYRVGNKIILKQDNKTYEILGIRFDNTFYLIGSNRKKDFWHMQNDYGSFTGVTNQLMDHEKNLKEIKKYKYGLWIDETDVAIALIGTIKLF